MTFSYYFAQAKNQVDNCRNSMSKKLLLRLILIASCYRINGYLSHNVLAVRETNYRIDKQAIDVNSEQ